jgi:two-component SAPR family response regulator
MLRAILIDDEIIALNVLEILLKRNGNYEVLATFTSPAKAFDRLLELNPDVVFLDMEMGRMNGLSVAELILKAKPKVKIVFVTAYGKYAVEAFAINASDYLLKPVREDRLMQTTQRLLESFIKEKTPLAERRNVQVFSTVNVMDGPETLIKWRTKKAKELFAYLWHSKGDLVLKDVLIEVLWPDTSPDKSVPLLHTTVYQLRKALPVSDVIEYSGDGYRMKWDGPSDYETIERILNLPNPDSEQIRNLILLYKDGYMAHEDYAWSQAMHGYIEGRFLETLEAYFSNHPYDEIDRSVIDKLLEISPYCERYADWMMAWLNAVGNRGQIIQFYNAFEQRLSRELNIKPSLELSYKCNKYLNPAG